MNSGTRRITFTKDARIQPSKVPDNILLANVRKTHLFLRGRFTAVISVFI